MEVSLITRKYTGDVDLPRIAALLATCNPWEQGEHGTLRLFRRAWRRNIAPLTCLWEDSTGELVACALILGSSVTFYIHPETQEPALQEQVMSWVAQCGRILAQEHNRPITLSTRVSAIDETRMRLLERHNFKPSMKPLVQMRCPLDGSLPDPYTPIGFMLRPVNTEAELEAYVSLFNAVNGASHTVAHRRALWQEPWYCPNLTLVAAASDGTFAAFCQTVIYDEEQALLGRADGWIELVGTHPDFRQRGLARALLIESLYRLKRVGIYTAILETTHDNAVAQCLYATLGFRTISSILFCTKSIPLQ